jgi:GH24 family phage-related lysozyme (muramidase)
MEGFQGQLYEDPAGYCTIGYGHLIRQGPCDGSEPEHLRTGISRDEALELLRQDVSLAERAVMELAEVDLDDGQYAALCDFTFNVGRGALARSTLLRRINEGLHPEVPGQFRRYVLANGRKLPGLVVRREEEIALFFENHVVPRAIPGTREDLELIDILRGLEPQALRIPIHVDRPIAHSTGVTRHSAAGQPGVDSRSFASPAR